MLASCRTLIRRAMLAMFAVNKSGGAEQRVCDKLGPSANSLQPPNLTETFFDSRRVER